MKSARHLWESVIRLLVTQVLVFRLKSIFANGIFIKSTLLIGGVFFIWEGIIVYLSLNDETYLVKGKVNGCIYSFKSRKMYSVNTALMEKIEQINEHEMTKDDIDDELKSVIDVFIKNEIIVQKNFHERHDIEDLKCQTVPSFAWIEITTKCNLKCKHCYNDSHPQRDESMSLQNFRTVVDKLKNLGITRIQIIGGEPFMEGAVLKDMLDYSKNKFEFIEVFTNGTLMDDEWIKYIKENGIHIALSVYSYIETEHDKVTDSIGSYKKTNDTIKKLEAADIPYRVCNVLMKDLCLGVKNTDLYELNPSKDVVRMSGRANTCLLSEELVRKKLITKETFRKPLNKEMSIKMINGHNCFNNKLYISADLKIYPCVMERRMMHGMIESNSDIILSKKIRELNKDRVSGCSLCEYRYNCFDCRSDSISEIIDEKPWYCTYIPEEGKWIDVDQFIAELREKEII
ncbi:radical SAM protein [Clostridium sp. SY8519]|uniref:radical SAM protein n=1 Tax=Clostridium sp. (strain SY8519) TaxID=1042156 RepID=UPI001FA7F277|nr:radical SAM protein [Clostridium sp. SY8519]